MISSGYFRCYYDKNDENHRKQVLGSAFWFTLFNSIIFALLSFVLAEKIASAIFNFDGGARYIRLITVSAAFKAHSMIFYNLLIARERARSYVTVNVITLFFMMILTVYFVVFMQLGVTGVLTAQVIAFITEFLILAIMLMKASIFRYSSALVKEMLKFSIPLIPLQVAGTILAMSDRFFLQEYRTLDEVGLYSLAYKFASVLPLLTIEPFKAFAPHIFALIEQPEKCKKTLADFGRYYMAAALILALIMGMFSREIIRIMSDQAFHMSYQAVFMLCLSYVFYGLYKFSCYANNIVKKNWYISLSWLIAVIVNLSLNFVLVPLYGIYGAMTASIMSYFVLALANMISAQRIYQVPYRFTSFMVLILVVSAIYYVSTFINYAIAISLILKTLLALVFIILVIYSRYFTDYERTRAREIVLSFLKK
jgi:O-antigen/teichoic acid export membrane protein